MYSFNMLADRSNDHFGFFTMAVIIGIILFMMFKDEGITRTSIIAFLYITVPASLVGWATWGGFKPEDIKTTAKFVEYVPQEQSHSCGTGKQPRTCYTNKVYGKFLIEGKGYILMEVNQNSPMPETATIYWNSRSI